MSLKNKFKLGMGILVTLLVVVALALYVSLQMSRADSIDGQLTSDTYAVGTDYTGVIVGQYVDEGDKVQVGQTLFEIKSTALEEALKENDLNQEDLIYPINDAGNLLIQASKPGTVMDIFYRQGSFVPANQEIAEIIDEQSVSAKVTFNLSPRDYAKLTPETRVLVRLPNGGRAEGMVRDINVFERDGGRYTEVTVDLDGVDGADFQVASGTPVSATIFLQEQSLYHEARDFASGLIN